jgi:uncharacterized protein
MRPQVQRLLDLQDVDSRLETHRKAVAAFPARLAEVESRVNAAKGKLTAARDAHSTALKDRKKYELDVEQWREKAKKYRDQSYEVKTNEAFRALQHEIANAEQEMARAEDRLLERMVSGEEYDRQIKAAEVELKTAESVAAGERKVLEQERTDVQAKLTAAETERAAIVAEVPESLLNEYTRIAKHRHGALAEAKDEMCMKCGVRIRPHIYQVLRNAENQKDFTCESCGRILYVADPVPPQTANEISAAAASASTGASSATAEKS